MSLRVKNTIGLIFLYSFVITQTPFIKSIYSKDITSEYKISVMTYNLENLFDTVDDPKIDDEAYLPLIYKKNNFLIQKKCQKIKNPGYRSECRNLDWTDKALNSKMNRISDVILKSHSWHGPDILILQEVENLNVLENLRIKFLKKHYPYPAILIDSVDPRGIDVAVLSKFKVQGRPKLHPLTSRGILEVELGLPDKSRAFVFAVHFPSQRSPFKKRKVALEKLNQLMNERTKDGLVIAGGDMNITDSELKKHKPFDIFKNDFLISHIDGCKDCKGTYYYPPKKSWSFFDVILVSKNSVGLTKDSSPSSTQFNLWQADPKSIKLFNQSLYQNNKYGSPEKFHLGKKQIGVSDHWPLMLEIFKN